jgi:hypothetical protein
MPDDLIAGRPPPTSSYIQWGKRIDEYGKKVCIKKKEAEKLSFDEKGSSASRMTIVNS